MFNIYTIEKGARRFRLESQVDPNYDSFVNISINMLYFFFISVDEAVLYAHSAIMENHGQNCCAGSRTYVHESIYDQFVSKAKELALHRIVGDPYDPDTAQGPLVSNYSPTLKKGGGAIFNLGCPSFYPSFGHNLFPL